MQADQRRSWGYTVFLLLVPLIALWRAVFLGQAIGPFDQIRQMAPWNGPKPDQPWDVLPADGVLQFYGWRDLVFDAWHRHIIPVWNTYELGGTPLLANSQSAALYPPHILFGLLGVPTALAITILAWFHLALGGLGVRQLAKALGADDLSATVGGASFSLSAFMVAWTALPSVITTVAWIPWILVGIAFEENRRKNLALGSAAVGMMFLAGHLQFAAYGVFAVGAFGLGLAVVRRDVRPFGASVGALALGGMLAAIQLLPVLNYSQFSHRRNSPTAEGYAGYVASSIQPFELASLSQATANGNPRRWANGEPQTGVSSYWPAFVKQGANYAESAVALGPWVLGLLLLVPWRRRETWVLASIGGLAFLLAIGTPLNALLYFGVPGWSSTGSPGRIAVLFVLVASVLAPLGLTELRRREATAAGPPPVALVGIGLVVLLAVARVLGSLATFPEGPVGDSIRGIAAANASSVALLDLVGIVVVIGTVLGIAKLPKAASAAILALPVVLAILADVPNLVMTGEPLPKVTGTNLARIAVVNEGWGLTAAAPALLPPNTAAQSRIRELGGYDSLLHRETVELLNDINGRDSAPPANGNMMFIKPGFNVAKLTEAGVQEVWSKELLPIALTKAPKTEDGIIKTWIGGPGLASLSRGTATIVRDELGQIDLKVQGSGRLTVRERAMPGWEARIDNQKLEVPPGRWIELDLPAGTTNVRLRYTPPGLRNGMLATFAGLLVLVGLLVAGRRKA